MIFRDLFETNVVATLHLSQLVLPGMREHGAGRIIIIGSTGGRFTSPGAGAYHVVKYGVEALSLALGAEVAPFGVRVVLIDPHRRTHQIRQFPTRSGPEVVRRR